MVFRRVRAFYNPWFIFPFLLWMLIGSLMLLIYDRDVLFKTVNLHHTTLLDYIMLGMTEVGDGLGTTLIILLMVVVFKSCRNWWFLAAAALCIIAPALLIQTIKSIVQAPRPLEYYKLDASWIHIQEHWPRLFHRSFPSGHSGTIFSLCCFISMILPHGWTRWGLALFILALIVAYSRMYLAAHFYLDIFVGSLLGTVGTMFCFALMRRISNQSFRIVSRRSGNIQPPTA
jgi:membrane-associated phospholipid phosphatase